MPRAWQARHACRLRSPECGGIAESAGAALKNAHRRPMSMSPPHASRRIQKTRRLAASLGIGWETPVHYQVIAPEVLVCSVCQHLPAAHPSLPCGVRSGRICRRPLYPNILAWNCKGKAIQAGTSSCQAPRGALNGHPHRRAAERDLRIPRAEEAAHVERPAAETPVRCQATEE
jgi:hypothetical protein